MCANCLQRYEKTFNYAITFTAFLRNTLKSKKNAISETLDKKVLVTLNS